MTKRTVAATYFVCLSVVPLLLNQSHAQTAPPAPAATPQPPTAAPPPAPAPATQAPAAPPPAPAPAATSAPAAQSGPAPAAAPASAPPSNTEPAATSGVAASASFSATSGGDTDVEGFGSTEPAVEDSGQSSSMRVSLGALVGAGFALDDTVGNVNAEGFGIGAQAGINLDKIFLGARFLYYLGDTSALPTGDLSMSTWLVAAEGGYDFDLSALILRPSLALGLITRIVDQPPMFTSPATGGFIGGSGGNAPQFAFYAAPGASLLLPISMLYVGVDARVPFAIGNRSYVAMDFLGMIGLRF